MIEEFKCCSKCKTIKPIVEFVKDNRLKSGVGSQCKSCKYKQSTNWAKENKEHVKKYKQKFLSNLSKEKKEFFSRNRNEYMRQYRKNMTPEKKQQYMRTWRKKNPDYWKSNIDYLYAWRKTERGRQLLREIMRKYRQTPNGHEAEKRVQHKRQRTLGYIELFQSPFPNDVLVDYHHINDILVIPLPHITHVGVGGNHPDHRTICDGWIEKIYCMDFNRLFNGIDN